MVCQYCGFDSEKTQAKLDYIKQMNVENIERLQIETDFINRLRDKIEKDRAQIFKKALDFTARYGEFSKKIKLPNIEMATEKNLLDGYLTSYNKEVARSSNELNKSIDILLAYNNFLSETINIISKQIGGIEIPETKEKSLIPDPFHSGCFVPDPLFDIPEYQSIVLDKNKINQPSTNLNEVMRSKQGKPVPLETSQEKREENSVSWMRNFDITKTNHEEKQEGDSVSWMRNFDITKTNHKINKSKEYNVNVMLENFKKEGEKIKQEVDEADKAKLDAMLNNLSIQSKEIKQEVDKTEKYNEQLSQFAQNFDDFDEDYDVLQSIPVSKSIHFNTEELKQKLSEYPNPDSIFESIPEQQVHNVKKQSAQYTKLNSHL